MGRNSNLVTIDKVKLTRELEKRGLSITEAAEEIGMSRHYFKGVFDRGGHISEVVMKSLKAYFNINLSDITPPAEDVARIIPSLPPLPPADVPGLDLSGLRATIYEAVYAAVRDALQ